MRIAVYKDNLSTGRGADRAVRNFAAGLAERGYDVALMEKAEFLETLESGGRFDVIVATGSNEIVDICEMGYFRRNERARVVLQLHLAPRGFFKWRHPLRNRRIRKAFDCADAVQVLCSAYVEEFKKIASHPPVTVIGNYVEKSACGAHDEGARTILYPAAALTRVKNQKLLIEAFALVAAEFPEWKVRLLGKDTTPYAKECRGLARKKGIEGRVEFVGFTDRLAEEYVDNKYRDRNGDGGVPVEDAERLRYAQPQHVPRPRADIGLYGQIYSKAVDEEADRGDTGVDGDRPRARIGA